MCVAPRAAEMPFLSRDVGHVSRAVARAGSDAGHCVRVRVVQPASPNSRAISIRWTSLVPSPISRILESRHIRATGYSFMKP